MQYDIISLELTHPSFKWGNGLYAVIEKTEDEIKMCRLEKNYKPQLHKDGSFMITVTGINNDGVKPTDLKLFLNKD